MLQPLPSFGKPSRIVIFETAVDLLLQHCTISSS